MGERSKFQPRNEWPNWISEPLERVGIGRYETVETILPKIEDLGLTVLAMEEDWGGMMSTYPLYYVAVTDLKDESSIRGEYWSETDYAEALAWATARVLDDRATRERQRLERLASTEPDEYTLREFGLTLAAARFYLRNRALPEDAPTQEFAADILVGDEVIARVATPFPRGTSKWDADKETQFQDTVRELAKACDLRGRRGPVRLVLDPGTMQQVAEDVDRRT